jgi:hypothetical protein
LLSIGVSIQQLTLAGFEEKEILKNGLPLGSLKNIEPNANKLVKLGLGFF